MTSGMTFLFDTSLFLSWRSYHDKHYSCSNHKTRCCRLASVVATTNNHHYHQNWLPLSYSNIGQHNKRDEISLYTVHTELVTCGPGRFTNLLRGSRRGLLHKTPDRTTRGLETKNKTGANSTNFIDSMKEHKLLIYFGKKQIGQSSGLHHPN